MSITIPPQEFFGICLVVFFFLGLILPVGLLVVCGTNDGTRWLQNCASVTIYVPLLLPFAVAVLGQAIWSNGNLGLVKWPLVRAIAGLTILLAVALCVAYRDFLTVDALPFVLRGVPGCVANPLDVERQLRACSRSDAVRVALETSYANLVCPFGSFVNARARGNWLIYPLLFQSFMGAVVVAVLFWYSCVVAAEQAQGLSRM